MYIKYDDSRIDYLTNQLAEITLDSSKQINLGRLALEILLIREGLEEILESDVSEEKLEKAKGDLKKLRELEKSVVKIYILSMVSGKQNKSNFMNYLMSKYTRSGGRS